MKIWLLIPILLSLNLIGLASYGQNPSFSLPPFEKFLTELPDYKFGCLPNTYFSPQSKKWGEKNGVLLKVLDISQLPDDFSFNQMLRSFVVQTLYDGLVEVSKINPHLAEIIYQRSLVTPIEFVCDHESTHHGGIALVSKRYFFFGQRIIHLDSIIAQLLPKGPKYGGDSQIDLQFARRTTFHELLHHLAHPTDWLLHDDDVFRTGARRDIVYSCSAHAFHLNDVETTAPNKVPNRHWTESSVALNSYSNLFLPPENSEALLEKIPCLKKYFKIDDKGNIVPNTLARQMSSLSQAYSKSTEPDNCYEMFLLYRELHRYDYYQCSACATARYVQTTETVSENSEGISSIYKLTFEPRSLETRKLCSSAPVKTRELMKFLAGP
jgi:hypothetical protein